MPIRLVIQGGPYRGVSKAEVLRRVRAMMAAVASSGFELSLVLTGDTEIQELNRIYRMKDRPTDVLAFAQREGEFGGQAGRLLGDVVVSVPTARRQAEARKQNLVSELTMLLAHGLLHLLGWDHQTAAENRRMRRETSRLCAAADAASLAKKTPASRVKAGAKAKKR